MTITKSRAQSRAFWIIDKSRDGLEFSKRRFTVRDYAQLMGWVKNSQKQYLGINQFHCPRNANQPLPARLKGVKYGSKLSQSQLLAGLGNSFSVPVFQAIAENMPKCFNGQKVNSDSEDSDSDSVGASNDDKIPVHQEENFHTPIKKRRNTVSFPLSYFHHGRKANHLEAAIDEQTALERDAKYNSKVMTSRPKKACKPKP